MHNAQWTEEYSVYRELPWASQRCFTPEKSREHE